MTSNQKLLLAVLAAPLMGALLFFLTAGGEAPTDELVPTVVAEGEPAPLEQVSVPEIVENGQDAKAAAFMEARWGHLGDAGAATPHMDPTGDMFFVVPKIFRGRDGQGNPVYARAYAKPERLGETVRASQGVARMNESTADLRGWDGSDVLRLQSALGPIDDPSDLPEELQKEHPLHPAYDGPPVGKN